ncbi:MAG: hypothetical protein COX62_04160 [Deltaproteobacteria bacterium CG_4_10_14_0_2_um_filter_43_8]|nr:MAG: hypothetical protein COV43_06420 [Deltaproteobacteria bacterium CG11_big_fil_rev_8_21_14_0_20_42_23]PJA20721.1 MAG: hypothetical protein COX62_04160 [Deltaproteobacteria bacterium CG_4_10_14_0_2_um_filter_43_8]PJC63392.1 MAG: hypothetical protein CO021_09735 [Deltaproteobacteria bacterium CG_4_9_14_0_2_um_filter_42_21]
MKRIFLALFLAQVFVSAPTLAGNGMGLEQLIQEALISNPEIQAAKASLLAAEARIPQAGAWDDPRASVEFSNVPVGDPSLKRTPMSGIQYGLKQNIPFPGKKGTSKKKASLQSDAEALKAQDTIGKIIWELQHHYYQYFLITRSIDIIKRNQNISKELVAISQQKFASNMSTEQDVLKAQIDYGSTAEQLLDLEKEQTSLRSHIEFLVGHALEEKLLFSKNTPNSKISPEAKILFAKAQKTNWRYLISQKQIDVAKMEKRLATLSALPNVDLGLAYRQRAFMANDPVQGEDFFSVSLSVPLPIFAARKQNKKILESKALLQQSQALAQSTKNRLSSSLEEITAELKRTQKKQTLIRQALLPQAKAAFANSKSAYQTGKIEFINVLTNQLSVQHFELELVAAETSSAQAVAKLNYLLGKNFASPRGESHE